MNNEEKAIARILFVNKVLRANGQKFEDIFTSVMNYSESDFQQIKPWGNIGDRKNDGYIKSKGVYFQVFAPEEINKSYVGVVNKIETDFAGLTSQWSPVKEFYFVVNDKYHGVHADCEKKIQEIKKSNNLSSAGFLTAKDIENVLFDLSDDKIFNVAGFLPDPMNIKTLNYSILSEVIEFVMKSALPIIMCDKMTVPDWDEKVKFNKLTALTAKYLGNGYLQIGVLENYLKNNGKFLSVELQKKLYQIYICEKQNGKAGDDLFWAIVSESSPKMEMTYQSAVVVLMAKYFESCDIFEEPVNGGKN